MAAGTDGGALLTSIDDADNDPNNEIQTIVSADAGNLVAAGTDGGAYLDQATVQTNESNTSLSQDTTTGVISYVAEDGLTDTANVTSTDPTNILTTGSDGGAFLNYQGIRSNTTVQEGSGFGVGSPYKIGNPSTGTVDLDINIADIIIFTNPSGGSASIYVELKSLGMDDSYLGKVVKIVQYSGSSPKVTTYDSNDDPQDYSGGGTLADLFDDANKPYESVSFIWAEKTTSLRQWFPMQ